MHMFQMILVNLCTPFNDAADKQNMLPDKMSLPKYSNTKIQLPIIGEKFVFPNQV